MYSDPLERGERERERERERRKKKERVIEKGETGLEKEK